MTEGHTSVGPIARCLTLGLIVLLMAAFPSVPAIAERPAAVLGALARVEALARRAPDDVLLVRASGQARPAQVYDYLFAGDRIELSGQGTNIGLRYRHRAGIVTVRAEERSRIAFEAGRRTSVSTQFDNLLERLSYWWSGGRRPIGQPNVARDPTLSQPGEAVLPLSPVFGFVQHIDPDRRTIVPIWRGRAAQLRLVSAEGTVFHAKVVLGKTATRVELDRSRRIADVRLVDLDGRETGFRISRTATRPAMPQWIARIQDGAEARLAAAAWLALDGPGEWRLEGASRLAELAEKDLAAQTIWEALLAEVAHPR